MSLSPHSRGHALLRRGRSQAGLVATTGALLAACAMLVALCAALMSDGQSRAVASAMAHQDGAPGRPDVVLASVTTVNDMADPALVAALTPVLDDFSSAGTVSLWSQSPLLYLDSTSPERSYLIEGNDLADHASVIEGVWPRQRSDGVVEIAVPLTTARALGVEVGDTLAVAATREDAVADDAANARLEVTAIVQLDSAAASRDLLGGAGYTASWDWLPLYGPFITADGQLDTAGEFAAPARVSASVDLDLATVGQDVGSWRHRVDTLGAKLDAAGGATVDTVIVTTTLGRAADQAAAKVRATQTLLVAAALLIVLLAASATVHAATLLTKTRQAEAALLVERGATARQLLARATAEAVPLAAAATALGIGLATVLYRWLLTVSPLDSAWGGAKAPAPGITGAIVAGAAVGAAVPAIVLVVAGVGGRQRRGKWAAAAPVALDGALALLAAICWWVAVVETGKPAALVLGALAPVLAVAASAAVATRVIPVALRLAERRARRTRGLGGALTVWQAARFGTSRAATLTVIATATASLAGVLAATWNVSAIDQADAATGADVVVSGAGTPGMGDALAARCAATTAVIDRKVVVGSRPGGVTLLAFDTAVSGVLRGRLGGETTWESLMKPLVPAPVQGVNPIDNGGPLMTIEGTVVGQDLGDLTASASLVVADPYGDTAIITTAPVALDGQAHSLSANTALPGGDPASWKVVAIDLTVAGGDANPDDLNLASPASVSLALTWEGGGRAPWQAIVDQDMGMTVTDVINSAGKASFVLAAPSYVFTWASPHVLLLAQGSNSQVPIVVTQALATALDLGVGDRLQFSVAAAPVRAIVVAVVPYAPSAPHAEAVFADSATLLAALRFGGHLERFTDAWWAAGPCSEDPSSIGPVAAAGTVTERAAAQRESARGALGVGVAVALLLATAAAACLALMGAALQASAGARRSRVTLAKLRGLGASARTVTSASGLAHIVISMFAGAWGIASGVAIAAACMRFLVTGADGAKAVPAVRLSVPAQAWWVGLWVTMLVAVAGAVVQWRAARRGAAITLRESDAS